MKQFLLCTLLLFAISTFAQSSFKYGIKKISNTCERGADSIIRNNISMPYASIGVTKEIRRYNEQNKVMAYNRYYQGKDDYGYTIYYHLQTGTGFKDSSFTKESGREDRAGVSIYGNDSLCIKSVTYMKNSALETLKPVWETTYSYDLSSGVDIQNGRFWYIHESGQRDAGTYFSQRKYKDGQLFSDSSWGTNRLNSYTNQYNTYSGDTIIDYSWDSTWYGTYYEIRVDSTVRLSIHKGDQKITFLNQVSRVEELGENINYFTSSSIDTLFANGIGITWLYDNTSGKYIPYRKSISTEKPKSIISIGYSWVDGKWQYSSKAERLYMIEGKKCLGKTFWYKWADGNWELEDEDTYYYNGLTAVRETEGASVCKLPNPFFVSYPFSCEALVSDEAYTLRVFDLSGRKMIDEEFYVDQSIGELTMLYPANLYYFVITNSQNELISKQKILMGY